MNTKQKVFLGIGIFFAVVTLAFIIPTIWYFFDNSIAYGEVNKPIPDMWENYNFTTNEFNQEWLDKNNITIIKNQSSSKVDKIFSCYDRILQKMNLSENMSNIDMIKLNIYHDCKKFTLLEDKQ